MVEVLLVILKILGIALLSIIGLILLLVCVVLFVPVRYKYRCVYNDDNKQQNCNYIDIYWIMHIIKCRILISLSGASYETSIFGIRIKWLERLIYRDNENSNTDIELTDEDELDLEDLFDDSETNEDNITELESKKIEDSDDAKELLEDIEDIWEDLSEDYSDDELEKQKDLNNSKKKLWKVLNPVNWYKIILDKLISLVKFAYKFVKTSIKSIQLLLKRIDLIMEFLDRKSTILGIERVKKYSNMIAKSILPRKRKIELTVGFDDPSYTGYVTATFGTLYPIIGRGFRIYPNFSEKELKFNCKIVGKVRGVNVIYITIRVMKDKIIKRLLYNFNKLKEEL